MIVDLDKFIAEEKPFWSELEGTVEWLAREPAAKMDLAKVRRLHYLYERAAADLAKLNTFASAPAMREYLESLVSRAYCQIHETRRFRGRLAPLHWLGGTLPRTFRRHINAFWLSAAVTLAGAAFGATAMLIDPDARDLMPFGHNMLRPSRRVEQEQQGRSRHLEGHKAQFSAQLMQNNIKVSITAMALGMTWGVGTILLMFYNGAIIGLIAVDYVADGQTAFLLGWLLPHGAVEIPAIVLAGQAGLVLGGALIGWGSRTDLRGRMRAVGSDLMTLMGGVAVLLVWAGLVEAFLSQYHEPILPYWVKIAFGAAEIVLLTALLTLAGRRGAPAEGEGAMPQGTRRSLGLRYPFRSR